MYLNLLTKLSQSCYVVYHVQPIVMAHRAKYTEILSEKVPGLSNLGSNLTHYGAKPTIPGLVETDEDLLL